MGLVPPTVSPSLGGAASVFLSFFTAASKQLKAIARLKGFASDLKLMTTEVQGLYSKIDFSF